jgi:hypothetical protein
MIIISLTAILSSLAPYVFIFGGIGLFFHAYNSKAGSTYFEDYRKEQFKIWHDID